jgi:hypothetical protein
VLAVSPRESWRGFDLGRREALLMTGVRGAEVLAFTRWLGEGFDLPTVDEWRALDRAVRGVRLNARTLRLVQDVRMHPAARALVEGLCREGKPTTWGDLALLNGGIFEWVRQGGGYAGMGGRPRPEFFRTLFNPQRDDPVQPYEDRSPYFGFRPIRRPPAAAWEKTP